MDFINLTNGIQAIEDYNLKNLHFIRIQSTWCEQKEWERIILTISDDFLMYAALNVPCVVYDYGANKNIPRAIWQGLEWIKFVLTRVWYNTDYHIKSRGSKSMENYFNVELKRLSAIAYNRIAYYRKYLTNPVTKQFNIQAVTNSTDKDNSKYHMLTIRRTNFGR
jgi:hypothetical protein